MSGGRYELDRIIGRGGMALVFLARDREHDARVALKVLADNLSADPHLRERFRREADLGRRLSHPNVVSVLASGETDGRAFMVLEYVDGGNLAEELLRAGPLPRSGSQRSGLRPQPVSPMPTSAGSSTATSSRRTSCLPGTARSRCPTSVSRGQSTAPD